MPFVAICKKCLEDFKKKGLNDDSEAYMVDEKPLENIYSKIVQHFMSVHACKPEPEPFSLSWSEDFQQETIELPQENDDSGNLIMFFRGPGVRQFESKDYIISTIRERDYYECASSRRRDLVLYHYNYAGSFIV